MKDLVWLVPLLPFVGALLNGVVLRNRLSKRGVTTVACGSVLLSLLVGMAAIGSYLGSAEYTADSRPSEMPDRMTVAGPVSEDLATSSTGRRLVSVK